MRELLCRHPRLNELQDMDKIEMKVKVGGARKDILLAAALVLLCGIGSVAVAVAGGWQRGAVMSDQLLLAGVNVIAVLAAQLLPVLGARLSGTKKASCLALWSICMGYATLGHAWYLLASQERAGQARVEAMKLTQAPSPAPGRDLPSILNDKARVIELFARLPGGACDTALCVDRQRFRRAALDGRIAALDAEAQEIVETRQSLLQREEQQRQAKQDLVGSRMASSLGLSYAAVTWVMALTFAIILEGVGCLCWAVVLRNVTLVPTAAAEDSGAVFATAIPADVTAVTSVDVERGQPASCAKVTSDANCRDGDSTRSHGRCFDLDVERVTQALRGSSIRLTVRQVRDFLQCAQPHARDVRKYVAEVLNQPSPNDRLRADI